VSITVLACASPDFNSAYFVFCDFINQTGCKNFKKLVNLTWANVACRAGWCGVAPRCKCQLTKYEYRMFQTNDTQLLQGGLGVTAFVSIRLPRMKNKAGSHTCTRMLLLI
jgi:uncharacterized protein YjaG (DUF416 family)